jgi:SRSO17 transposase
MSPGAITRAWSNSSAPRRGITAPLLDDVARDANEVLGDEKEAGFYIDESSFLKKGTASVGVQRQWSGRAGKVENCQVGVFGSLGKGGDFALVDFRLFLPESWAQDAARCKKAKVPEDQRVHKAKWELALEMVSQARKNGLRFGWVGVDSLYGHNNQFLNASGRRRGVLHGRCRQGLQDLDEPSPAWKFPRSRMGSEEDLPREPA